MGSDSIKKSVVTVIGNLKIDANGFYNFRDCRVVDMGNFWEQVVLDLKV